MRKKYGYIIFILIVLLLLSGATLFLAKDKVASFFNNQESLAELSKPAKIVPSKNVIDDSVLKTDLFKSLKNNVNNFDFASICKRQTNIVVVSETVKNSDGTEASSTSIEDISCQQGNNNPFLVKTKK